MPIAVELRTTCERCKDPLPLNAYATSVPCWACLYDNPIPPEHWAQVLRGVLDDAWAMSEGEARTESHKVGPRVFELRASIAARVKGPVRHRPSSMSADLFPGVKGLAGEETDRPTSREDISFRCGSCGAVVEVDGRSRQVVCTHCTHSSQLSDEAWRRIHPLHAQRAFFLITEDDDVPLPRGTEAPPPGRETKPPHYLVWDSVLGRDGLVYALVSDIDQSWVVCLEPDLSVRWRSARKDAGTLPRVAVVGDEVWLTDHDAHHVRRFARADGKALGKLGGIEPANATAHHLDLYGAADIVGCADGTALALTAHRLVRYDERGQGILTWPPATGFFRRWFGQEKIRSLYVATGASGDDPASNRAPRAIGEESDLGRDRPLNVPTSLQRMVTAVDGSLWICGGTTVYRYSKEGALLWRAELPGCTASIAPRPGLDGELALYLCASDPNDRQRLLRVSPDGRAEVLATEGIVNPNALFTTPDGRTTIFGASLGDVRVFDRRGTRLSASGAAIEVDRQLSLDDALAEED